MIDRESRNKLAEEVRHFVEGFNTNFAYDDIVYNINTKDICVIEIRDNIWLTYDDLRQHKMEGKWALTNEQMDTIKRCIVMLKSDVEYKWPKWPLYYKVIRPFVWLLSLGCLTKSLDSHFNGNGDLNTWPFLSATEYEQAKSNPVYCAKST